jgi:hypothetical protein
MMTVALAALIAGCGSEPEPTPAREPISADEAPEMRPIAGGVTWRADAPLAQRASANSMRAVEYGVRGHADATLAVFYFGDQEAGGGSVESNIARWLGQLEQPDGRPTASVAERGEREVSGMHVHTVDARGTFVGRLGMGGAGTHPGWRMLGAIVAGPRGLVFFKLTGPEPAVAAAEVAFERLVDSLEPI